MGNYKYTNKLSEESSPYLLLHSHNPVNWYPWSDEALVLAKQQNKPILISIGYFSCHWCHVMARESFEDEEVASVMNDNFICIKVDREERPDVDHVYMQSVQLMNKQGGWPLNIFALPDGKPFYGGTYFDRKSWIKLCEDISNEFSKHPDKIQHQADNITENIILLNKEYTASGTVDFSKRDLSNIFDNIDGYLDHDLGGVKGYMKFPMPVLYSFLLRYYARTKDKKALHHINLTLDKMAMGGIYDHIGGGFFRYSTDKHWKIPHFEKMLYDNAQLISLYSEAYLVNNNHLYEKIVYDTFKFVENELTSPDGGFYSSINADSEGEEGKYYVWTNDEIKEIAGKNYKLISEYFDLGKNSLWEHHKNVLNISSAFENIADSFSLPINEVKDIFKHVLSEMYFYKQKRVKPDVDKKIICSLNCLMMKACLDAYKTFKNKIFLELAEKNYHFITNHLIINDELFHSCINGETKITAFLDDYSLLIRAMISFYEVTLDFKYLDQALSLATNTLKRFFDETSGLFFYNAKNETQLISPIIEMNNPIIPSSNSVMAYNLFYLGKLYFNETFINVSKNMLSSVKNDMKSNPISFPAWASLIINEFEPFYEIVIVGKDAVKKILRIEDIFLPHKMIAGSTDNIAHIPILEGKYTDDQTPIFICVKNACLLTEANEQKAINFLINYDKNY